MLCSTQFSRRIAIGLVALTLTAGGILLQPTAALAGFGTSPASDAYRSRTYWRGPVWPVLTWFFGWACRAHGESQVYEALCQQSLTQLGDLRFGEYYEPSTGEPLGSTHQSWTAAVALLWLDHR